MRHILYKYLTGASMIALTFSLNISTANATCSAMPTCEEMGYTYRPSCTGGLTTLACPFDTNYAKCVSSTALSCSDLGYKADYHYITCPDGVNLVFCPLDSSYAKCDCAGAGFTTTTPCEVVGHPQYDPRCFSCQENPGAYQETTFYKATDCLSGKYLANGVCHSIGSLLTQIYQNWSLQTDINSYIPSCIAGRTRTIDGTLYSICDQCASMYSLSGPGGTPSISSNRLNGCSLTANIGDYYYSDNTISSTYDSGKQLIGVIVDKNKGLVMSVDETTAKWSTTTDISIPSASTSNYDGLENTNIILDYAATSGKSFPAAKYCHDKADGGKSWFLPDNNNLNGFASSSSSNLTAINNALTAAGKTKFESSSCLFGMYEYWTSTFTSDSPNKVERRCAQGQYSTNATKTETSKVRCMFKI